MNISLMAAAIATALALAPDAGAQTPEPPEQDAPRRLDNVVVIGVPQTPMPANSGEARDEDLEPLRPNTSDTAQLLRAVPGLNVQGAGGVSGMPAIHGLGGDRNRVQVDGMDIVASCPNHMNPPLSYIDPSRVGTIKVYAGISPVSAGGDSIGGSIQVQSAPPRFAEPGAGWDMSGELGARWRSNGNARAANVSATLANEVFSLGYDGSLSRADNYRAGGEFRDFTASGREGHDIARDEVASSAYLVRNHALGAALRHGDHLWQASYGRQEIPLQLYPNQRMDMTANTQNRWQLSYQGRHEWGAFEARAWREQLRHSMGFGPDRQYWYGMASMPPGGGGYSVPCAPIGPTCAADMPMESASRTQSASAMLSLDLRPGDQLRVGAEWHDYRLDDWWPPSGGGMAPGEFWNINHGQRKRASLFAEWEGRLSTQWMALFGLRHDRVSTNAGEVRGYDVDPAPPGSWGMTQADAAAFNARARQRRNTHLDAVALLRYSPSRQLDVELGYALKTRSPNLYERYAWSSWAMAAIMNNTAGDGNGYVGDPDLRPETAHTVALTLDWHASGSQPDWRLRLTPWHTRVHDYIDAVPLGTHTPEAFNVLRHANQSARLYGIDLLAEVPLAKTAVGDFGLKAVANWQRGENRDTGQPLYNTMPPNARLSLGHQHGGWDNAIEWVLVAAKERVSPVRNEIPTHGYGLLNLRAGYGHGPWRIDAGIDNLFDRLYALPTGGTYLAQGRTMGINAIPWGIAVPGAGRSYYAAVKFSY
ncbi:TonB-dependent receptor [Luteimonas sp. e5]